MSFFQRIARIARGYVVSAGNRMERVAAEEELRQARARKQVADELQPTEPAYEAPAPPTEALSADFRRLGLTTSADLHSVEQAWRALAARADPKRFPPGSDEEKRAAYILKAINESYERIREALNPTEGRFGRLEL